MLMSDIIPKTSTRYELIYHSMFEIKVKAVTHYIEATNWEDFRIYLYWKIPQQDGQIKSVELGYLNIEDEQEDDLEFRNVPDEIVDFVTENRQMLIDEAEY